MAILRDAHYWRAQAEVARSLANSMASAEGKQAVLEIAASYAKLANQLQEHGKEGTSKAAEPAQPRRVS